MDKLKDMIKEKSSAFVKILRALVFVAVIFMLVVRSYEVLSWKDTFGDYMSSTNQLYSTDENLMDVVFVGSSHCYCGINPAVLWEDNGISAFNMATSGQDKDSSYHYLMETLKTQSPKVVFVELWGLTFDEHLIEGNVHRNMMGMTNSQNSFALIDKYVEDEEMQNAYKMKWPIIHTRYKELDRFDFIQYDFSVYGRGADINYMAAYAYYPTEAVAYIEADELSQTNKKWVDDLHQLSIEEEFELVFFLAPSILSVEEQGQVNAVRDYAAEREIPFFDYNQYIADIGLEHYGDFIDNYHLNAYGAEKLTRYIGNYLTANYQLEDHRGDEAYALWDKDLERFKQLKEINRLKSATNIRNYISILNEMDNITWFVTFEGNYKDSDLGLEKVAKQLGLSDEQYEAGGTYAFIEGKLFKVMDNMSTQVYIYELNEYDSFKVENMALTQGIKSNKSDIMFNVEPMGTVDDGLQFVVYDHITGQVVSTPGYY